MALANVLLKRHHAASDNKTHVWVKIFPNSRFQFLKLCCDRYFCIRDRIVSRS
jgi:hypothetical protein